MTDIVEVIRDLQRAYPLDVFPYPDDKIRLEVRDLYPGFIDGISAGMGRHIASKIQPAADEIEFLRQQLEILASHVGIMYASSPSFVMVRVGEVIAGKRDMVLLMGEE